VEDLEDPYVDFHAHPFYEIYYYLEGPVERYVVGGKSYLMKAGDILLIPPGISHHPIFNDDKKAYRRYVLWVSVEQLERLAQLDSDLVKVFYQCREHESYRIRCSASVSIQMLENYLMTMWKEEQGNSACKEAYLYAMTLNFLVLLNRVIADDYVYHPRNTKPNSLMDQVLAYIHENYTKAITLTDVADHFYTSSSSIEMLLTKKLGKPFYRYVTECRIIHAQSLITNGVPLKEVGIACGYNDYSNFYRAFTREVGISPSQYRRHMPTNHFQSTDISKIT
jgi:AraC-like DNA-binding protein